MKKILLLLQLWLTAGSVYVLAGQSDINAGNPDKVKVYVKQDPAAYQKSRETLHSNVQFAVQLSASSKPASKSTLKSWEDIGPVYVHTENGLYKVRIGPYSTQEGAKTVLLQAKARGTKDAFIVVQQGIENHKPYEFPEHPVAEQKSTDQPELVVMKEEGAGMAIAQAEYKVRLASYLHPGAFKTSEVEQYGSLESYRQGEWTIMLIGGIKSEAEARRIKDEVVAKGFKDAAVVMDQDGILVETH